MQQYYTLEEAASKLMLSPDELRQMAKSKKIRAFQDKGSWRFRTQDVEEEARKRGVGSDPEVQVGESSASKAPSSVSKRPSKLGKQKPADEDALAVDFDLEEKPSGGTKSSLGKSSGPKSPRPKAASDSDVRLVMDSDQDFQIDEMPSKAQSSGPKSPSQPKPASASSKPPSTSPPKARKSKIQPGDSGVKLTGERPSDSDVKVVPAANDSDVKPKPSKSPSDSDIRLQEVDDAGNKKKKGEASVVTEEVIDLDAEEEKLSKSQPKPGPKSKVGPKPSSPSLPTNSPFELSEDDLNLDEAKPKTPSGKVKKPESKKSKLKKDEDSSSDFELIPFDSAKSPVELGSGEIPLLAGDEDVDLGTMGDLGKGAGHSGINLDDPADSGISLEDGGSDEVEFELTLDSGVSPKPAPASTQDDEDEEVPAVAADESSSEFELSVGDESSSEFELSLDDDAPSDPSSSEFELSLDDSGETSGLDDSGSDSGSDSEFELTLDDEGDLAVDEDAGEVFEPTNFDVPSLDDDSESGSEAVAIDDADTDLDGSDFKISLDDDSESDSESQVVALEDEDEADAEGPTVAKPRKAAAKTGWKDRKSAPIVVVEDEDEGRLDFDIEESAPAVKKKPKKVVADEDEDEEEEEEEEEKAAAVAAPPPEWGVLPALMLMPAVIILFLVGIMGFELIQGQYGYQRPAKGSKPMVDWIARPVAEAMDAKLPD